MNDADATDTSMKVFFAKSVTSRGRFDREPFTERVSYDKIPRVGGTTTIESK